MVKQDIIRLSKQTLVYGIGYVAARMINFLLLPFYSYHISPEAYGAVSLIYAFIAFLNIFYHYGLESAFLRFYSRTGKAEGHGEKEVFSTVLSSLLITSIAFSALIWLFAPVLSRGILSSPDYTHIIRMTAGILFLDAMYLIPLHYLRINNKALIFTLITLVNVLINVSLNIYLIRYRGMGIEGVFISNMVASAFSFLVLIPVVIKNFNGQFSRSLWKKLILFGLPFVPSGLSSMIIELSDRYMLQWFKGLEDVGLYSAGHKLGIFMMLVVMAFRFAWQPFFLQKHDDPAAPRLFSKIMTWFVFLMTIVFLLVSFFIKEIVSFEIMGRHIIAQSYWAGITVVPLILAAYLFNGIYINFHPAIFYTGKTWVISVIVGIAAAINIVLNLILIPQVGMIGAGISSLSAYVFMAVCTYFVVRKWMPVVYEWGNLAIMFVLTLSLTIIFFVVGIQTAWLKLVLVGIYMLVVLFFIYPKKRVTKHAA
ncbi:MAG: oligosaccharide flippase family protein [Candidatus Marinimicrobia bacterium]|nr:oligosaccharide flippase family protein [Candidatus Neomarinimicrobiota bacterium]